MRNQVGSGVMTSVVRLSLVALLSSLLLQKAMAEVRVRTFPGIAAFEWDPVPNASYYQIYGRVFGASSYDLLKDRISQRTFHNYETSKSGTYSFQVRVVYLNGGYDTIWSDSVSIGPRSIITDQGITMFGPDRQIRGPDRIYWGDAAEYSLTDGYAGGYVNRNNLAYYGADEDKIIDNTSYTLAESGPSGWVFSQFLSGFQDKIDMVTCSLVPYTLAIRVEPVWGKAGSFTIALPGVCPEKRVIISPSYRVTFDLGSHAQVFGRRCIATDCACGC